MPAQSTSIDVSQDDVLIDVDASGAPVVIELDTGGQDVSLIVNQDVQPVQIQVSLDVSHELAVLDANIPADTTAQVSLDIQEYEVQLSVEEGRTGPQGPQGVAGAVYGPTPPDDRNRLWIRTPDLQAFVWSQVDMLWLGQRLRHAFGALSSDNAYLSFFVLAWGSSNAPLSVPVASRICEVDIQAVGNLDKEFKIIVNGSEQLTFALVNGEYRHSDLAIDVAAGSTMQLRSGPVGDPAKDVSGAVYLREVVTV